MKMAFIIKKKLASGCVAAASQHTSAVAATRIRRLLVLPHSTAAHQLSSDHCSRANTQTLLVLRAAAQYIN
jgi:hypothetical protein